MVSATLMVVYVQIVVYAQMVVYVLKGHDFSRVSMVLRPTQVHENGPAALAPEGPKENSPGQAKRRPGKGQQNGPKAL
jgi:hypothetical protein